MVLTTLKNTMWFEKHSNTDQLTWSAKDRMSAIYRTQRLLRREGSQRTCETGNQ